jgi:hypothetical protein
VERTTDDYLHFREVEVFNNQGENVALFKNVITSDNNTPIGKIAVDGNTTIDPTQIYHSNGSGLKWWEVDLAADVCVSAVKIYNRYDGDASHASIVSNRLSNQKVTLRNVNGNTLKTLNIGDANGKAEIWLNARSDNRDFSKCDQLMQQFHRFDEELSLQGKWQGGSVTGVCKGWGTDKVRSIIVHILTIVPWTALTCRCS